MWLIHRRFSPFRHGANLNSVSVNRGVVCPLSCHHGSRYSRGNSAPRAGSNSRPQPDHHFSRLPWASVISLPGLGSVTERSIRSASLPNAAFLAVLAALSVFRLPVFSSPCEADRGRSAWPSRGDARNRRALSLRDRGRGSTGRDIGQCLAHASSSDDGGASFRATRIPCKSHDLDLLIGGLKPPGSARRPALLSVCRATPELRARWRSTTPIGRPRFGCAANTRRRSSRPVLDWWQLPKVRQASASSPFSRPQYTHHPENRGGN
jgi:hypothetical protein